MAIIYSYPAIDEISSDDLILISDSSKSNASKSATVNQLSAYVTTLVNLNLLGDTGTGIVNLNTQNLSIIGTTNEIETTASSQTLQIGLPDNVTITSNLIVGNDVQINTLTNNYIPVNNSSGVLSNSGFYQASAPATNGGIGLNTTFLDTSYGDSPDFRVAPRVPNTPGVIDLFRDDATVTAGESVGILQYSVLDDGRYAVAQIGVETLTTTGTGDSGGGKFLFKTAKGGGSGPSQNTPESRFTLDYNSANFLVPVNVTSTAQSSFAGQVTIPLTPVANTDAASKGYVDSKEPLSASVTLTAAQVLALSGGGSNLELIAAPGANKVIDVVSLIAYLDFGTQAYNWIGTGNKLSITTTTPTSQENGFNLAVTQLNASADTYWKPAIANVPIGVNLPLSIYNTSGSVVTQGDSPITFSIFYRIVDLS